MTPRYDIRSMCKARDVQKGNGDRRDPHTDKTPTSHRPPLMVTVELIPKDMEPRPRKKD